MNGINDLYYERIESTKSLLYGSPSHSLVSGSKYLTEKFLKDLKKTSSFLDSVHRKMREVME